MELNLNKALEVTQEDLNELVAALTAAARLALDCGHIKIMQVISPQLIKWQNVAEEYELRTIISAMREGGEDDHE